jgi:hypothetical protein
LKITSCLAVQKSSNQVTTKLSSKSFLKSSPLWTFASLIFHSQTMSGALWPRSC